MEYKGLLHVWSYVIQLGIRLLDGYLCCAHFGAMTMGADINMGVVRDGRECNVWSNFKQYNLPMVASLIQEDNNLSPWHSDLEEIGDSNQECGIHALLSVLVRFPWQQFVDGVCTACQREFHVGGGPGDVADPSISDSRGRVQQVGEITVVEGRPPTWWRQMSVESSCSCRRSNLAHKASGEYLSAYVPLLMERRRCITRSSSDVNKAQTVQLNA
eukprot:Gb_11122 [translate_table: standard]